MLENLRRMFENLNFGKTGFKTYVFEKLCISYSCILFIIFNALRSLCTKLVCFSKLCFFQNFDRSRLFFNQSKLRLKIQVSLCLFRSIEPKILINRKLYETFLKLVFQMSQTIFQKVFNFSLSIRLGQGTISSFLSFFIILFARFSSHKAGMSIIPFLLHFNSCFHA